MRKVLSAVAAMAVAAAPVAASAYSADPLSLRAAPAIQEATGLQGVPEPVGFGFAALVFVVAILGFAGVFDGDEATRSP